MPLYVPNTTHTDYHQNKTCTPRVSNTRAHHSGLGHG